MARFFVLILVLCFVGCAKPEAGSVSPTLPDMNFEEGAVASGLVFRHQSGDLVRKRHLIETLGAGVVVADFNGDEHQDVYLVNGGRVCGATEPRIRNALFFGDGAGRFRKASTEDPAADDGFGFGAVAADYDRDGDLDIYVCNWGKNVLLRNRGDGTFENVTSVAGVGDSGWSVAAAFGDVDGDGWLDLFVANYLEFGSPETRERPLRSWNGIPVAPGPLGERPTPDRLYRNRGDGTFEDISRRAGLLDVDPGYSLAVVMSDLDRDGHLDIYVAADSTSNHYWHNDGRGVFEEWGLETGVARSSEAQAQAGMGIVAEDLNKDGAWDLVVTNFERDYNTFYRGRMDGTFDDVTTRVGLAVPTFARLAFGAIGEDLDRDGIMDLAFANGHVYPEMDTAGLGTSYAQKNQLFRGLENGTFEDLEGRAGPGFELAAVSRGLVAADLDEDGRPDLVVNNLDGPAHLLWNRTEPRGHWLLVRLRGSKEISDLTCVGARVTVRAGRARWTRESRAGGSYASSGSPDLFFGLGSVEKVDAVEVRFADGRETIVSDVLVDRVLRVERTP